MLPALVRRWCVLMKVVKYLHGYLGCLRYIYRPQRRKRFASLYRRTRIALSRVVYFGCVPLPWSLNWRRSRHKKSYLCDASVPCQTLAHSMSCRRPASGLCLGLMEGALLPALLLYQRHLVLFILGTSRDTLVFGMNKANALNMFWYHHPLSCL